MDSDRVVLEVDRELTADEVDHMKEYVKGVFPGKSVILLMGGVKVANLSEERLARIEAKLDALHALLADDEDEAQADSLDDANALTRPHVTL